MIEEPEIEKRKPSIYFSDKEVEKFDKFDVDDIFTVNAKVRVSSKSKRTSKDEKGKIKKHQSMDLEFSNIEITDDIEKRMEGIKF